MTTAKDIAAFDFGVPANYQIVVQGTVSEEWSNRLGGMAIMTSSRGNSDPRTILQGTLLDQSALRGLLETLYALHLPILEVRKIGEPSGKVAVEDQSTGTQAWSAHEFQGDLQEHAMREPKPIR